MKTKNITRTQAAELINRLTLNLNNWSRNTDIDRGEILANLFDLVAEYSIPIPYPCCGEAHSNPYIDHCSVCMPNWGVVQTLVRVR